MILQSTATVIATMPMIAAKAGVFDVVFDAFGVLDVPSTATPHAQAPNEAIAVAV
jgi:hypothetical protein